MLTLLSEIFKDVTLDLSNPNIYTLLEADFSDTSFGYRCFDQAPYDNDRPELGWTLTQVATDIEAQWYPELSAENNL